MSDITTLPNVPVIPINDFVGRHERARAACEAAGIEWPGTILPEGTALYTSGVEKLRNDRAKWRRLPLASEVVGLVQEALAAERRVDIPVPVAGLRLREDNGRIVKLENFGNTDPAYGLGYGSHALRQLVAQIDPLDDAPRGFAGALIYLSDQERAHILNKRLARVNEGTNVTLRAKLPHSGSSFITRAALSERYASVTDHDIAKAIGLTVQGDRTGRLDYKPGDMTSRFEVIWPSEIPVKTFVVGDVHYAMLSITNSETGQGSLRIAPAVVRAACANLTISVGEGTEVVIRHIGDGAAIIERLRTAIRLAVEDLAPLLRTITVSAEVPIPEAWSPEQAIAKVAARYALPQATGALWLEAWKAGDQSTGGQYPASVWGIAQGIQSAAHKADVWTTEHEWERVAGDLQAKVAEVVVKGGVHEKALERALTIKATGLPFELRVN